MNKSIIPPVFLIYSAKTWAMRDYSSYSKYEKFLERQEKVIEVVNWIDNSPVYAQWLRIPRYAPKSLE